MTFFDRIKSFAESFSSVFTSVPRENILNKDLDYHSGIEIPYENPSPFLRKARKGIDVYDDMLMDDDIDKSITLKKTLCLSTEWSIASASDDEKDIEISEYATAMLNYIGERNYNPSFRESLDNLLDAMCYGYEVVEKRFGMYDEFAPKILRGKVGVQSLIFAHPRFFDFGYDEFRNFSNLRIGYRYGKQIDVPVADVPDKFVVVTYPYARYGNMYGRSDLESVYSLYVSKQQNYEFRNIYNERCGFPMLEVRFDENNPNKEANLAIIKDGIKNKSIYTMFLNPSQRANVDGDFKPFFEILKHDLSSVGSSNPYLEAINNDSEAIRYKLMIPDKAGVSTSDSSGGYALSHDQLDIFKSHLRSLHLILEEAIQPIVDQCVRYNYGNVTMPKFMFSDITDSISIEALEKFISTGIVDPMEKWIRPKMNVPVLTEEEQSEIDEKKKERTPSFSVGSPFEKSENGSEKNDDYGAKKVNDMMGKANDDGEEMKDEYERFAKSLFDVKKTSAFLDRIEADFEKQYRTIRIDQTEAITKQIKAKWSDIQKDSKKIESIVAPLSDMKQLFKNYFAQLYFTGKAHAIEEVEPRLQRLEYFKNEQFEEFEKQFIELNEEWIDRDWLKKYLKAYGKLGILTKDDKAWIKRMVDNAFVATGQESARVMKQVSQIVSGGLNRGDAMSNIINSVQGALNDDMKKYATTVSRTYATDYYNTGRMNEFNAPEVGKYVAGYMYDAIMDESTSPFCSEHNNMVIKKDDPALSRIIPPNHFNCRSTLQPIFIGEEELKGEYFYDYENRFKSWNADIADEKLREPAKDFGGK